jgi:hypothetical protein
MCLFFTPELWSCVSLRITSPSFKTPLLIVEWGTINVGDRKPGHIIDMESAQAVLRKSRAVHIVLHNRIKITELKAIIWAKDQPAPHHSTSCDNQDDGNHFFLRSLQLYPTLTKLCIMDGRKLPSWCACARRLDDQNIKHPRVRKFRRSNACNVSRVR